MPPTRAGATIRNAEQRDIEAIAAIYSHYVEHTPATFDLEPPSANDWLWRWRSAQAAGHPWWVANSNGAVAGYLTSSAFRPKAAYRTTVETTIYLAPEATGRGLGRALYELALATLDRQGFHVAVAGISLPNPASVGLHEHLGFSRVGVFEQVGHKLGEWRDVGWWQRRLDRPAGIARTVDPTG